MGVYEAKRIGEIEILTRSYLKQEISVDPAFGERLGVVWKADLVDPLLDVLDGPIQVKKKSTMKLMLIENDCP